MDGPSPENCLAAGNFLDTPPTTWQNLIQDCAAFR
jgi:hypothetical protein